MFLYEFVRSIIEKEYRYFIIEAGGQVIQEFAQCAPATLLFSTRGLSDELKARTVKRIEFNPNQYNSRMVRITLEAG